MSVPASRHPGKTAEIVALAMDLIRIPSVTVGPEIRLGAVQQAFDFICSFLSPHGFELRMFTGGQFPAVLAGFPGGLHAPVMLSGHFDVVAPEPDESQFTPRIEGDYLWGRGAADMKTVVATYLVWMKDRLAAGPPFPSINLLLIGNEEIGEADPMGTPHILRELACEGGYAPALFIAGERTEERGSAPWGPVCVENRGVCRFRVVARGARSHSGMASLSSDLTQRLIEARTHLSALAARYLTLAGESGWKSQLRFPFVQVGAPGVYNITPDYGELGVEMRTIPADDIRGLYAAFERYCQADQLEIADLLLEPGIRCAPDNPYLRRLLAAIETASGEAPTLDRKLAGTSARFAPDGSGIVWGQSGIGPHARDERHYLPSILPYYQALSAFAERNIIPRNALPK